MELLCVVKMLLFDDHIHVEKKFVYGLSLYIVLV